MEEKKTLKIKKPYLIIFTIAIVFAILGFIDLKVNAAELTAPTISEQYLNYTYVSDVQFINGNTSYLKDIGSLQANPQVRVGIYVETDDGGALRYCLRYDATLNLETRVSIQRTETYNGSATTSTRNDLANGVYFYPTSEYTTDSYNAKYTLELDTNIPIFKDITTCINYLNTGVVNEDDLYDVPIDYSQLQTDDNMPTIKNLKRNVIEVHNNKNSVFPSSLYDYLTWDNDMVETWELEMQFVPVVQYYDINLTKNTFVKEFVGDWYSKEIFTGVRNAYLNQCFDISNADYITNNPEIYNFYADCDEKYEKGFFEESYLYFGYRFRYIDKADFKCSPWVVLMPSHTKDSYSVTVEYADNTISDVGSGNGVHNKYEDLEDIEDAIIDVESENKFREEYGISDSEINVDEAKTWLDTVSEFIKGTPQFIGATLSFLPKPILYGMYVCIFMSVVAVGVAIFKALI